MKNILVIGAAGQIGSELVPELRRRGYMTVAAGSGRTPLTAALSEGGPTAVVNLLDADGLRRTVEHYAIDTIFNMAAILSAVGESKPMTAWDNRRQWRDRSSRARTRQEPLRLHTELHRGLRPRNAP